MSDLLMCARCKVNVRAHQHMGCLCEQCEELIDGMTQAQIDADYEAVVAASSGLVSTAEENQ